MSRRIVEIHECLCGEHRDARTLDELDDECPVYGSRVLEPGSFVLVEKVDGEWPSTPEWPKEIGDGPLVAALNTFLRVCWANDGIEPWVKSHGTSTRGGELSNFGQAVKIVHSFLDALASEGRNPE